MPESQIKDLPAAPAAIPALAYIPVQMPDGALVKVAVSALGDFDASITSLIGAEATAFDKVSTVGIPTNTVRRLLIGGVLQTYQLRAGADGDVLPEDYNASTNNRSWFQVVAQFEQIVAQAGLSGGGAFAWNGNTFTVLDSTTGAGNIGIHPVIQGSPIFYHTATIGSGIPNGFASLADHSHLKQRILNPNGPASNTAGWSGQLIYTGRTDGTSIHNLHGFEAPILFTDLGSEHSISTIGGGTPASPSWTLRVKVRYTASQASLTAGTKLVLRVDRKVAGIEAAAYSGTVVSANTLNAPGAATNTWETQIDLFGLDANHWNASQAADVSTQNADWRVQVPQAGAIVNDANKVSLARDTAGPTDQLIATWSTAHGLARGENVCVLMEGMTGLTGGWNGFHSGHVEEVRSTTVAVIRVRDLRNIGLRSFSGTAGATSQWAIYRGTRDPDHEVILPANEFTAQRDSTGRVRRVMVGEADVLNDDEFAIGVGGPGNTLRSRVGDLSIGGIAFNSRRAAMEGGLLFTGDLGTNSQVSARTVPIGVALGTGDFSVFVRARIRNDRAPATSPQISPNPTLFSIIGNDGSPIANYMGFSNVGNGDATIDGSIQGSTTNTTTTYPQFFAQFDGRVVDLVLVRQSGVIALYVNGSLFNSTLGPTSDRGNWSLASTAEFRIGGYFVSYQNYHSAIHRFAVFNRALSATDVRNLSNHDIALADRWGSLTPFYVGDYSAGVGANIAGVAGSIAGNIDSIGGQDDTLRFTMDSANAGHFISLSASLFPPGVRNRLTCDVFIPSGQALINRVDFQTLQGPGTGNSLATVSTTGSWQSVAVEFVPNGSNNNGLAIYGLNGSNYVYAGNGTDVFYIKNLRVQRIGALLDIDLSPGCGEWFRDRSLNRLHAVMSYGSAGTTNNWRHLVQRREGEVYFDLTASGNTQILGGLPTNARIRSVTAWAANPVTLSLGTGSGGTQIVNAQSLNLGLQDVALAGRFSVGGALWANLSSAIFTRVTVKYEIVEV